MDWIRRPVRLKKIFKDFGHQPFTLLDVGCANHSPSQTKRYLPSCVYHGLDKNYFDIDHCDKAALDRFYMCDLDSDSLDEIAISYDAMVLSHVLEHLKRPYDVLKKLCARLKKSGKIYIEFPRLHSLGLSSMEGTLQFCDDPTHVFLPDPYRVVNILLEEGIRIQNAGTRRDWVRCLASPLFLVDNLRRILLRKRPRSKGLWDITGFAFAIYGEKIA